MKNWLLLLLQSVAFGVVFCIFLFEVLYQLDESNSFITKTRKVPANSVHKVHSEVCWKGDIFEMHSFKLRRHQA